MKIFEQNSEIPAPLEELFAYHERLGAFQRLSPPWQALRLIEKRGEGLQNGTELEFEVPVGPLKICWLARHLNYEKNISFSDEQVKGPFKHWIHRHGFKALSAQVTHVSDTIQYEVPAGEMGQSVFKAFGEKDLISLFHYRTETLKNDLAFHLKFSQKPKRILVTGASGFVGQTLCAFLSTGGHELSVLVRKELSQMERSAFPAKHFLIWNPDAPIEDLQALENFDAVIHLSGENIAGKRRSDSQKERILKSRTQSTAHLSSALSRLQKKPAVFVSASAMGIYAEQEDTETLNVKGDEGFLSQVCKAWEAAAEPARQAGIRVVHPRISMVLHPQGGALEKMLKLFKWNLGAPLGSGEQSVSWITLEDLVRSIAFATLTPNLEGPFNACSPQPLSNRRFSEVLAHNLHRILAPAAPPFVLRLMLGEMANELLLKSFHLRPLQLEQAGFQFLHGDLGLALATLLGQRFRPD